MKTIKCVRIEPRILEKVAIETTRQKLLIGDEINESDLIRFYIEEGLKTKKRIK